MKRWRVDQRIALGLRDYFERKQFPFPHVDLYYWRPDDGRLNFGDYLSRVVVDAAAARHGLRLEQETALPRRMLAIGSILHLAQAGDVVWGSGINGRAGQEHPGSRDLDVRAVRGPYTRETLGKLGIAVPEIYGDPAILLPVLLKDVFRPTGAIDVAFVPNLHDMTMAPDIAGAQLVSPFLSWNRCIEAITAARLVVSSSLHGLIIAEAYGIPARYLRLSSSESLFKFKDYYAGSGRDDFAFATSLAQAVEMGGERPPVHDTGRLLEAFPIDLWANPPA